MDRRPEVTAAAVAALICQALELLSMADAVLSSEAPRSELLANVTAAQRVLVGQEPYPFYPHTSRN